MFSDRLDAVFIAVVTRDEQERQRDDADDDSERVDGHEFETVVRSGTEEDNLELLLVGEPEEEREPRDTP